jgi:hypothetical protein
MWRLIPRAPHHIPDHMPGCALILALPAAGTLAALVGAAVQLFA